MRGIYNSSIKGVIKIPFVIDYKKELITPMLTVPYLKWFQNIYGSTNYPERVKENSYETLGGEEIGTMLDLMLKGKTPLEAWEYRGKVVNCKLRNRASFLAINTFYLKMKKFINTLTNPKLYVIIKNGEIDLIDTNTIYDIKTTRGEPDEAYWNQLWGYYINLKLTYPHLSSSITKLAVVNPRKDILYTIQIPLEYK